MKPLQFLDAICRSVSEILGGNDDFLEQGWKAALNVGPVQSTPHPSIGLIGKSLKFATDLQ
jgi:hypothetical protein